MNRYDLAGDLITQTDALNNALWFKYDALNRLEEKRQTNRTGSVLASYTYDQGANAIGHRTGMTDSSGGTRRRMICGAGPRMKVNW